VLRSFTFALKGHLKLFFIPRLIGNKNNNTLVQYRLRRCWCDQHHCKSPAIEVYGNCRSWLRVRCWFFCNPELKNCWHGRPGIEPTTLDLSFQSGAYDLLATATPLVWLLLFLYFSLSSKRGYFLSKNSSLIIDWLTAYSRLRNLDFKTIPYTFIVSYSHLNYPCLNLGNDIFWHHYFVFLIIKSGFFCSCDLYNHQSWLRSNHRVRWLF